MSDLGLGFNERLFLDKVFDRGKSFNLRGVGLVVVFCVLVFLKLIILISSFFEFY